MGKKYDGEKSTIDGTVPKWGTVHTHYAMGRLKKIHVLYMHHKKAAEFEITYDKDRQQWERNGRPLAEGAYDFVLTKDLKMFGYNQDDINQFNKTMKLAGMRKTHVLFKHSSPTGGDEVYFAGTGKLKDARFAWDRESGHYTPKSVNAETYQLWLNSMGVKHARYCAFPDEVERAKPVTEIEMDTISI
jgi:hypothetical protein